MIRRRIRDIRFGEGIERIEDFLDDGDTLLYNARNKYSSALARAKGFANRNPQMSKAREFVAYIEKLCKKIDELNAIRRSMWDVANDLEEK